VDFVEDPERSGRQLAPQDTVAVPRDVPAEIGSARARQAERQRSLADLARAGDERHLAREVAPQCSGEVTRAA